MKTKKSLHKLEYFLPMKNFKNLLFLRKLYWSIYQKFQIYAFKIIPSAKVLLYHKVGKLKNDQDKLAVSPDNFLKQILYLKKKYKIIDLNELGKKINLKRIDRNSMLITFDDGYFDNYKCVYSLIKRLNVPITIFVSNFADSKQKNILINNSNFIREMNKSGLVTIAAHTYSHQRLSLITAKEQKIDIQKNKNYLENILKKKIEYFAYPFGQKNDYTKVTMEILKRLNFKLSFTAFPGIITGHSNRYELPRYIVKNWCLEVFKEKTGL